MWVFLGMETIANIKYRSHVDSDSCLLAVCRWLIPHEVAPQQSFTMLQPANAKVIIKNGTTKNNHIYFILQFDPLKHSINNSSCNLTYTPNILSDFPQISTMLRAIRMPLYYTIAGLFISIHNDSSFIEKKINKLIIPYCFFVLLGNIARYIKHMVDGVEFTYFSPLYYAITEDKDWLFYNYPIWFLVSLFDVYIIYLIINYWCPIKN